MESFFIWLFWTIVSYAVSYALAPDPKSAAPKAATREEFTVPTAEDGRTIPVIFGTMTVEAPNVVWWGDLGYQKVYS